MSAPGVLVDAAAAASAAAGAGPSPAAVHKPAAAAVAVGASAGSVFVKRSDDAVARFAPVEIFGGDAVGHLAERASRKLDWRTTAAYVDLFLIKPDGDDEPTAAEEEAALTEPRLQVGWLLPRARISSGAWVVARLPSRPAAGPGECARAARSLLSRSPSRGGRRASRDAREIPLGSSWGAHPFLPCFPLQAAAAVAATQLQHPAASVAASVAAAAAAAAAGAAQRLWEVAAVAS